MVRLERRVRELDRMKCRRCILARRGLVYNTDEMKKEKNQKKKKKPICVLCVTSAPQAEESEKSEQGVNSELLADACKQRS